MSSSDLSPKKRKTNVSSKPSDVVVVGVRKESKSIHERRVPIVPEIMTELMSTSHLCPNGVDHKKIQFCIQPAEGQRIIPAEEFKKIGVEVNSSLNHCDFIIGIKEIPKEEIQSNAVYCFFSHVIKAQPYNMPMLKCLMQHQCTLIDYEKMTNEKGARVVAFGRQAGQAGTINGFFSLGQRLPHVYPAEPNPFARLKQAIQYGTSVAAKADLAEVGKTIVAKSGKGLPACLVPMIIVVTGKGNVAGGVFDILSALEGSGCLQTWAAKDVLPNIESKKYDHHHIYQVILDAGDLYELKSGKESAGEFTFAKFNAKPEEYTSTVARFLPHTTMLVNAVFWRPEWPMFVSKVEFKQLWKQQAMKTAPSGMKDKSSRLLVIADITCDIEGSVECTVRSTMPDSPSYVYHPETEATTDGFQGDGVVIMGVDILPTELPLESSRAFCNQLKPYLPVMVTANYHPKEEKPLSWEEFLQREKNYSPVLKSAVILYHGKLTPNFEYLAKHVA